MDQLKKLQESIKSEGYSARLKYPTLTYLAAASNHKLGVLDNISPEINALSLGKISHQDMASVFSMRAKSLHMERATKIMELQDVLSTEQYENVKALLLGYEEQMLLQKVQESLSYDYEQIQDHAVTDYFDAPELASRLAALPAAGHEDHGSDYYGQSDADESALDSSSPALEMQGVGAGPDGYDGHIQEQLDDHDQQRIDEFYDMLDAELDEQKQNLEVRHPDIEDDCTCCSHRR
ncbi:hypothetical protein BDV95DRAFT_595369 [Massariosphaeria phaeospora]|uniref:Uncharacterized protein n=1 Tax=Massariosphaeria phaeospora TaxID=100035 RepID=A0A7C8I9G9_9PLEO|nr:hypothetical protein BDV95DRAFT_595369 [Massariosphaeria phaeospora]